MSSLVAWYVLNKNTSQKLQLPWYSSGIDNFTLFWYAEDGEAYYENGTALQSLTATIQN